MDGSVSDAEAPARAGEQQGAGLDEDPLLARLRAGDSAAFAEIVRAWSPAMLRLARTFVASDATAQDVVQETWLAVVHGLSNFEGRASVRTWVFRILVNRGKTRGVREARTIPFASLGPEDLEGDSVEPSRFRGAGDQWPGHWSPGAAPTAWEPSPEDHAIAGEIRVRLAAALAELPERQRVVVSLRDVHGMDGDEVCDLLGLSQANQRVLLHRGRAKLRQSLEDYYRHDGGRVGATR
jgi:RNA polymerase sigma-70 factor (ECF subfamily)